MPRSFFFLQAYGLPALAPNKSKGNFKLSSSSESRQLILTQSKIDLLLNVDVATTFALK